MVFSRLVTNSLIQIRPNQTQKKLSIYHYRRYRRVHFVYYTYPKKSTFIFRTVFNGENRNSNNNFEKKYKYMFRNVPFYVNTRLLYSFDRLLPLLEGLLVGGIMSTHYLYVLIKILNFDVLLL